jgi:hypothetical protein
MSVLLQRESKYNHEIRLIFLDISLDKHKLKWTLNVEGVFNNQTRTEMPMAGSLDKKRRKKMPPFT